MKLSELEVGDKFKLPTMGNTIYEVTQIKYPRNPVYEIRDSRHNYYSHSINQNDLFVIPLTIAELEFYKYYHPKD